MQVRSSAMLAAIACLALAACATSPPAADTAAAACSVEPIATLPLLLERHMVMVAVKIDGHEAWLGVDTGAQATVLTEAGAARLGLPRDPRRRTNVVSAAGVTQVQNVRINDLQVGDTVLSDLSVAAVALPQPDVPRHPADGLLGADVLSRFDVAFDFAAGTLGLYEVSNCHEVQPPWPGRYATLPMQLSTKRLPLVTVQVDGQDVTALFDSGSDRERLARRVALRLGVSDAALANDRDASGFSLGGASHVMRIHRFASLHIGDENFAAPLIEVGALADPDAGMLVGLDFMRGRRFWLSYATHRLFIQRATP